MFILLRQTVSNRQIKYASFYDFVWQRRFHQTIAVLCGWLFLLLFMGLFCCNLKWNKMRHANTDRLCCCFLWRYDNRCSILNRCKCKKKKNWSNKQWRDGVTSNGNKSVCLCHIDWSHRFPLSHMWTQWIHGHKIVNQKRKKKVRLCHCKVMRVVVVVVKGRCERIIDIKIKEEKKRQKTKEEQKI